MKKNVPMSVEWLVFECELICSYLHTLNERIVEESIESNEREIEEGIENELKCIIQNL